MPTNTTLDVQVLGQLLLMQTVVASLPDDAIIPFVTQGLSDVPGIRQVVFHAKPTNGKNTLLHFHLTTGSNCYGELAFRLTDETDFQPYIDHIRNFTFMLSIILDERQQRRALNLHQTQLEQQVATRTAELAKERDTAQRYLDIAGVVLLALDCDGKIMMINKKGAEVLGQDESTLIGTDWFENFVPVDKRSEVKQAFNHLMSGDIELTKQHESNIINATGEELTLAWNSTLIQDDTGNIVGTLSSAEDITLRKQQEEHILHQAHFDSLTDLPNRFLSLDRLSQLVNEAQRNRDKVAVLFLDLDDFKKINDTLGHDVGDTLLIQAAERMRSVVRSGDTVGRLGGDEFIILLSRLTGVIDAHPVVENLLNRFRDSFIINNRELILTASIGIAVYPNDGDNPSNLLRNADSAMYYSKKQGRNTYSYFTEAMNQEVSRRLALEKQMHGALDRGEFSLCYQPQVDINSCKMIGVEALLRWHNPALGDVSPVEFIPIAEQTGLILPIGQFVLSEALGMAAKWQKYNHNHFTMAINLSPVQFRDPHLVPFIEDTIHQSSISGQLLEMEITEGVLMGGHAFTGNALAALSSLGISIAMDDFGTGYSSLSYLRTHPFNILKIDRSFISDISVDTADRELVNAAIAMAHGLGLKVIAEGVETENQLSHLATHGCDIAQGYLFSKAAPAQEITKILDRGGDRYHRTFQSQSTPH